MFLKNLSDEILKIPNEMKNVTNELQLKNLTDKLVTKLVECKKSATKALQERQKSSWWDKFFTRRSGLETAIEATLMSDTKLQKKQQQKQLLSVRLQPDTPKTKTQGPKIK